MLGQRPQDRQSDGVVAADADRPHPMHKQLLDGDFDALKGVLDREGIDGDIPVVGDAVAVERIDPQVGMVWPDEGRLYPNMPRPEAGSGSIGGSTVEWYSDEGYVQRLRVWHMWEAHKRWNRGKSRMH